MDEWMEGWYKLKKDAIETGDYVSYLQFLNIAKSDFSQLYSELNMEEALTLVETIIKEISKELKWVKDKQKEKLIDF